MLISKKRSGSGINRNLCWNVGSVGKTGHFKEGLPLVGNNEERKCWWLGERGLRTVPKTRWKRICTSYMGAVHFAPVHGKGSFSMKDMGEADVIFGIKIKRENKHNLTTLRKYSRSLIVKIVLRTRPDIAYAVGRLSRFTSNPSRQHWKAITRVFKYLRGTMNYGLSYMGYPSVLEGYSDASWINHVEDSSSRSGWVFLLGGALAAAGKEAEWLRNLIHEIPIWPKPIAPISIRCDSAPTMAKAYSQIYNGKSRHLDTQFPSNTTLEAEFNVESSQLEIGTRVFIFPRCKTKRITYVNMKFCRFKKLGLGFLYVH
ncbi:hypothetical protein Tco_1282891 [Tanacetum coccineum]